MTWGGLAIKSALFGEATIEPGEIWIESPFDGICGMASKSVTIRIINGSNRLISKRALNVNGTATSYGGSNSFRETCGAVCPSQLSVSRRWHFEYTCGVYCLWPAAQQSNLGSHTVWRSSVQLLIITLSNRSPVLLGML